MTVDISVIAVSWNTLDDLPLALESVHRSAAPHSVELLVVDNGSTDGSVEHFRERDDVRLIELGENTGFTRGANVGAAAARGRFLLFLNPDVIAEEGAIAQLVSALDARADAWGATPWFRNPDGTAQRFWQRFPDLASIVFAYTRWGRAVDRRLGGRCQARRRYADLPDPPGMRDIDAAGAACLLVRRGEFLEAGAFDERFFNFFQDGEYARRMARQGRVLLGVGSAEVRHLTGLTVRRLPTAERDGQFMYAYRQFLAGEPPLRRWAGELSVRLDAVFPRRDRAAFAARALRRLD